MTDADLARNRARRAAQRGMAHPRPGCASSLRESQDKSFPLPCAKSSKTASRVRDGQWACPDETKSRPGQCEYRSRRDAPESMSRLVEACGLLQVRAAGSPD